MSKARAGRGLLILNDDSFTEKDLKLAGYTEDPQKAGSLEEFQVFRLPITKMTLDAASVNAGLFVSADGVLVTGTISMAAGEGTVQFVPDAPFAANAFVQVFATTDIQDLDGNALNNFASSFRIVPDSSAQNAFLQDVSPFSGATNVPTNAALEALYSEPLDPAAVNAANIRVFGAAELTGTLMLINGDRTIRFVPDVPLEANRFHFWQGTTQGADDASQVFTLSASFTTGAAAEISVRTTGDFVTVVTSIPTVIESSENASFDENPFGFATRSPRIVARPARRSMLTEPTLTSVPSAALPAFSISRSTIESSDDTSHQTPAPMATTRTTATIPITRFTRLPPVGCCPGC